jgi:hypothetical protein
MGVIGTDLLSLVTVQLTVEKSYFSLGPCNPDELREKGLTAIDQKGSFRPTWPRSVTGGQTFPLFF